MSRPPRHKITGRIEHREFGHSRDAFPIEICCLGLHDVTLQDGELVVWGVKPDGRSFAVVNWLANNRVNRVPNFQSPFRASQSIRKKSEQPESPPRYARSTAIVVQALQVTMPCLEPGPRDCSILQIESVRSLCINLFLGQLKRIMPVARRQTGDPANKAAE